MKRISLNKYSKENAILESLNFLGKNKSVIMLPTETVYGIACNWNDDEAKHRIEEMKSRKTEKHMQLLTDNLDKIIALGADITPAVKAVVDKFCPGPLTLVVNSSDGTDTIGFRIPNHDFVLELVSRLGRPITATSANISGEKPATSTEEALSKLLFPPDLVIDAGKICSDGRASTVADFSQGALKILRHGPISETELSEIFNQHLS